jgi:uncharacterized protein YycO
MLKIAVQGLTGVTTNSFEELRGVVRPGDVIVASTRRSTGSAVGRALGSALAAATRGIQGDKTHSLMVLDAGNVVDVRPDTGIVIQPIQTALKGLDATVVRPKVSPELRAAAVAKAKEIVSEDPAYDYAGALKAVIVEAGLPGTEEKRTNAVTCSSLIAHAYSKKLTPKPRVATLPVDFLRSKKLAPVTSFLNRGRRDRES